MTIDFTCQKCEGSFELDADDLIEGTEKLQCPHCDQKASASMVDDFTSALAEVRTQIANLSKKFAVSLALESEDVAEELEEDEEEDEDEDFEDDEDSDDDDDDDDDLGLDDDDDDDYEDEDADDDR